MRGNGRPLPAGLKLVAFDVDEGAGYVGGHTGFAVATGARVSSSTLVRPSTSITQPAG